jgi:lipopolysaccharide heptosyltransferase II/tetraacyldisaccharide 4'-kinase
MVSADICPDLHLEPSPRFLNLPLLATLYGLGARARRRLYEGGICAARRLPAPVVSIGNLTVGGTGKTPLTLYLARLFQGAGYKVAILSRGYGGRRRGVTCVSDGVRLRHTPPEVGEEPYELARSLPGVAVYTGACRYAAGLAAWEAQRPEIFLLDDGFQHFQLHRDLDLVLLDAESPFGNGKLLPAGPLREPVATLNQADALILTRFDEARHAGRLQELRRLFPDVPIFTAAIEPIRVRKAGGDEVPGLEYLQGLPVFAFAGLARPWVFQETLAALGADLRGFQAFPDHHHFSPGELSRLVEEARRRGVAVLITTAKDYARLGEAWEGAVPLLLLEVAARVEPDEKFREFLYGEIFGSGLPGGGGERWAFSPNPSSPQPLPLKVRRRFRELRRRGLTVANPETVWEILVRVPNWLGDAVMALPVLAGLRRLYPAAGLTILALPRVAPMFEGQPGVREVIPYPSGRGKWHTLLKLRRRFDLALALPNSFEAVWGLWLTGVPYRVGYAADCRSPLLTTTLAGRRRLRGLHQVFYYLGLLTALGEVAEYIPPQLLLSEAEHQQGLEILGNNPDSHPGPWVGLAPGAAYGPAKRWPPERFAAVGRALAEDFGARLVILGGPEDRESAATVADHLQGPVLNLAGKTSLHQALQVLSRLAVLITNDSGLMHAAAALATPVVALFGSTDPHATGPFSPKATVIHHPRPCSPCLKRTCTRGYPCLTDITVPEVAAAAGRWLRGGGGQGPQTPAPTPPPLTP